MATVITLETFLFISLILLSLLFFTCSAVFSASAWGASLLLFRIAFAKLSEIWEGRNRCLWPFASFSTLSFTVLNICFNSHNWGFMVSCKHLFSGTPKQLCTYQLNQLTIALKTFFIVPHYSHSVREERYASISWRSPGSNKKWVIYIWNI